jgi:hypothetical protein
MRAELGDDMLGVDRLLAAGRPLAWPGATDIGPVGQVRRHTPAA